MKIRINHILKRLVSICTCLTFLISTICIPEIIAYAAESNFEKVTLSLDSNVVNDKSIDLYVQNSVYYITIGDLCKLTRCSKSVEDNMISVKQGIWDTQFDVAEQVFSDDYQTVNITILKVSQNKYAIPALMFLSYYKAMSFIENNTLYCTMSECTPWEALNVDYDNSLVNIYELYGGKGNVVLSLTLDIIMDFIMGNDLSSDGYMKDAYMEALNVDLYSCKAVKNYVESNTDHLYNDLGSEKTIELLSVISAKQEYDSSNAESLLNISQPALEFYIDFVAQNQIREFYNLAFDALDVGDEITMNRYADQIAAVWKDGEAQKILTENKIKTVDGTLFLLSAAIEAAQQIKYAKQANNLVYRVMGQENLNKLNLDVGSNEWFQMANIYKSTSVALQDSVTNILDELQGKAINDLVSEAVRKIEIDSLTGIKTGEWAIALETARISVKFLSWIDSLVSDTWLDDVLTDVSAYKADRLALYLSELQQNVFLIVCNESNRLTNNLSEPDAYSDYIYAQQLYCRTSIAMYENLICMVDEFGKNREYWKSLFQSRIDALAISLYQLTMIQDDGINECLPLDLTVNIEISSYLEQHEQLVEVLGMKPTEEYWQFPNSKSYVVDKFYLEWNSDDDVFQPFSMKNMGTSYVKLYGSSIGDNSSQVEARLLENGWVNHYSTDEYIEYIAILNDKEYLLHVYADEDDNMTGWYVKNWPEGDWVAEDFEKLRNSLSKGEFIEVSEYLDSNPRELVELFNMQVNTPWQFGDASESYHYDDFAVEWKNSTDYIMTSAGLGLNTEADDGRIYNVSLYGIILGMTGEEVKNKLTSNGYIPVGSDNYPSRDFYAKNENGKRYGIYVQFYENQLSSWYWCNWREGEDLPDIDPYTYEIYGNPLLEFIQYGGYLEYTKDWSLPVKKYCFFDLNQDGIEELIIASEEYGSGFANYQVYAMQNSKIVMIKDFTACYGIAYSEKYHSIVFSDTRPSVDSQTRLFEVYDGAKMIDIFYIQKDLDTDTWEQVYTKVEGKVKNALTEDEYMQYLNETSDITEWLEF